MYKNSQFVKLGCPSQVQLQRLKWRHDTQHNDTQHNDIQHNGAQYNGTQHDGLIWDTQHK